MMTRPKFRRRLQLAAWVIVVAMVVELFTLLWAHPLAFMVFLGIAAPLLAIGIFVYFFALLSLRTELDEATSSED